MLRHNDPYILPLNGKLRVTFFPDVPHVDKGHFLRECGAFILGHDTDMTVFEVRSLQPVESMNMHDLNQLAAKLMGYTGTRSVEKIAVEKKRKIKT